MEAWKREQYYSSGRSEILIEVKHKSFIFKTRKLFFTFQNVSDNFFNRK